MANMEAVHRVIIMMRRYFMQLDFNEYNIMLFVQKEMSVVYRF